MHKLNDQWIEVIDGQEHMVKEVSALSYGDCNGCFLFTVAGCGKVTDFAPCSHDTIIKDLGILKCGCLPCPFCGEYPNIFDAESTHGQFCIGCPSCHNGFSDLDCENLQQAIDTWNRRS